MFTDLNCTINNAFGNVHVSMHGCFLVWFDLETTGINGG